MLPGQPREVRVLSLQLVLSPTGQDVLLARLLHLGSVAEHLQEEMRQSSSSTEQDNWYSKGLIFVTQKAEH